MMYVLMTTATLWCVLAVVDSAWGAGGVSSGDTTAGQVATALAVLYLGHVIRSSHQKERSIE